MSSPPSTKSTPALRTSCPERRPSRSVRRTRSTLLRPSTRSCASSRMRRRSRSTGSTPTAPSRSSTTRPTISTRCSWKSAAWIASPTSTAACRSSAPAWPTGRHRAREKADGATATLVGIFEQFQSRWPDPNRGVGIDSYPEYRDILDKIVATGLAERRQEWRRRLSEWSGQDLVPLAGAFGAALDEIRARLNPVNDILATLPFGPANDRLRISLRVLHSDAVARFRKQLAHLASGVTADVSDEQAEQRFLQLRSFIALIRKPDGGARHGRRQPRPVPRRAPARRDHRRPPRRARPRARHICVPRRQERRRDTRTDGVHRRCRAALPARRRGPSAAVRAGVPRRGLHQVRLRVRRPVGTGVEEARVPADRRRPARQGDRA